MMIQREQIGQHWSPYATANFFGCTLASQLNPTEERMGKHRHRWRRWGTHKIPRAITQYHPYYQEPAAGEVVRDVDLFDVDLCKCGVGRIARTEAIERSAGGNRTIIWPKTKYFEGGLVVGLFGRPIEDDGGLLIADN
jgi:hypothetical protein